MIKLVATIKHTKTTINTSRQKSKLALNLRTTQCEQV